MNILSDGPLAAELERSRLQSGEQSFAEILANLDAALDWLVKLGVRVPGGHRFVTYRDLVADLAANYEDGEWHQDKVRLQRAINALYEVSELTSLHAALAACPPPGAEEKLTEFIQGPEEISGEERTKGGIAARNAGFELHTAARIARGGYTLTMQQRADILFGLPEQRGLIECKRVRRRQKVSVNIRHARQQALSDTDNQSAENTSCLLSLDLSFVLNPNNVLLGADVPLTEALRSLSDQIAKLVDAEMLKLWHTRLLGVMVRFSCIAASEGFPHHIQWWVFMRNAGVSESRQSLCDELAHRLQIG